MPDLASLQRDIAIANRILAREEVVDAYGHVSVRHPRHRDRFLLSCSRSPELVTPDDIMEFGLDGAPADRADRRQPYLERFIHAAIYAARDDVAAVVHNHSPAVVPFSVTAVPLRPLIHVAGLMGVKIPVWDISEKFGGTNLLVSNMDHGRDLARALGTCSVVLMRGHGCSVAAADLKEVVIASVYLQLNATLQMSAMRLGNVKYLSEGEVARTAEINRMPSVKQRVWDYLVKRADCDFA